MKSTQVFFTMILSVLIGLIVGSCKGPGDDCSPNSYYYTIDDFRIYNRDYSKISVDSIVKDSYGIWFEIMPVRLHEPYTKRNISAQSFVLEDQCLPTLFPKDSIVALRIVTETDFNDTLPAGSEIANLFKVVEYNPYCYYPKSVIRI